MADRIDDLVLLAYIEDELDAADRRAIELRLAAEPKLFALVEAMRADRQLLRSLPRQSAPADLVDRVTRQLERATLLGAADESFDVADAADEVAANDATTVAVDSDTSDASAESTENDPVIATITPGPVAAGAQGQPVVVVRMSRWLRWANYSALAALVALGASVTWRMFNTDTTPTAGTPATSATASPDTMRDTNESRDRLTALDSVTGKREADVRESGAFASKAGDVDRATKAVSSGSAANAALALEKSAADTAAQPTAPKALSGAAGRNVALAQQPEALAERVAMKAGPSDIESKAFGGQALALDGASNDDLQLQRIEIGKENQYAALTPAESFDAANGIRRGLLSNVDEQNVDEGRKNTVAQRSLKKAADPAGDGAGAGNPLALGDAAAKAGENVAPGAAKGADPARQQQPDAAVAQAQLFEDAAVTATNELAELAQQLTSPDAPPTVRVQVAAANPDATREDVRQWALSNRVTYYDNSEDAALAQVTRAAGETLRQIQSPIEAAKDGVTTQPLTAAQGQARRTNQDDLKDTKQADAAPEPQPAAADQLADKQSVEQLARQRADLFNQKLQSPYGVAAQGNLRNARQVVFVVVPRERVGDLINHLNGHAGQHARYIDATETEQLAAQVAEPANKYDQPTADAAEPAIGPAVTPSQTIVPGKAAAPQRSPVATKPAATPTAPGTPGTAPGTTPAPAPNDVRTAKSAATPSPVAVAPTAPVPAPRPTADAGVAASRGGADQVAQAGPAHTETKPRTDYDLASQAGGRAQLFGQIHSAPLELTIERANWGLILGQQLPAPPTVQLPEREEAVTIPIVIEPAPLATTEPPATDTPNAASQERVREPADAAKQR